MDDVNAELTEVRQELSIIQCQIEDLLEHQSTLQQRQSELEALLQQNNALAKAHSTTDLSKEWDNSNFPWSAELSEKQWSVFNISTLRPMQLQTMNATMAGKDSILIMPTGGGKSLCFQLPAIISKGISLVVSPLVSLMEDQQIALESLGIASAMMSASLSQSKVKQIHEAMTDKKAALKILYVTPEKLAKSKRFMAKLEKMYSLGRFSHLVIDEVHCCSQWGHDFRPDYKFLGIMKRQFPEVAILGLTATATTKVLDDVKTILSIPHSYLFRTSFNRPNLFYEVREKPSSQKEVLAELVKLIQTRFSQQSGIVYCFSRKDAEEVTQGLQQCGIKSGCYHSNMNADERSRVHRHWLRNSIHVVVATIAFGMGIDKAAVRFVIHHSLSKSMENFYQESGRAGRDGDHADCILFYRLADVFRQSTMVFIEKTGLDNLYGIMAYCISASRCRRSMIARHFGELWKPEQCNGMCDHCAKSGSTVEKVDITDYCKDVIKILEHAVTIEKRLTALKLIDVWFGCGGTAMKGVKVKVPSHSRSWCERALAYMLSTGNIKEDFHFTPYTTISYIIPGVKAAAVKSGMARLSMNCCVRSRTAKPTTTETTACETVSNGISSLGTTKSVKDKSENNKSSSNRDTKLNKDKPKLSIVNKVRSKVASLASQSTSSAKGEKAAVNHHSVGKRRKAIIVDDSSDDELSALDFGDIKRDLSSSVSKRMKSNELSCGGVTSQSITDDCVYIGGPTFSHSKAKQNTQTETFCGVNDCGIDDFEIIKG